MAAETADTQRFFPFTFLEQHDLREGRDYHTLRFDSDVGKHGDNGTSEVEVVRAVLDGRADAGAIGSLFWDTVRNERLVPARRQPSRSMVLSYIQSLHVYGEA